MVKLSIGLTLSLASVLLVLRDVDLSAVGSVLSGIDHGLALSSLGTVLLTTAAKALRWRLLLGASHDLPATKALSFTIINHTINNILPVRLGELARVYLAAEKEKVPVAVTLGSIVLEKALDSAILLVSMVVVFSFLIAPGWLWQAALVSGGAAALTLLAAILALRERETLGRWLGKAKTIAPQRAVAALDRQVAALLISVGEIGNWRCLAALGGWSATVWLLSVATNHLALLAMGINLPVLASVFLLAVLQIGVALPSAPGRLGVFQAAIVFGLSFFSLSPTVALAYSLLLYVIVFIPVSTIGVFLIFREQAALSKRANFRGRIPALARLTAAARGVESGRNQ